MTNATTEQFDVKNRWSGKVQFTAEIEVTPDMTQSVKLGLAVRWARGNDAYLRGADLRGVNLRDAVLCGADLAGANLSDVDLSGAYLSDADLRGANLSDVDLSGANLRYANLRYANLSGVNLRGADLSDAVLRLYKSCLWMTLTQNKAEVPALLDALKNGRVDGSQYEGECACLVGTIANAKNVDHTELHHNSNDPSEQWFLMIKKGDKPTDDTGGGFASRKVVEWIEEWQSFNEEVAA